MYPYYPHLRSDKKFDTEKYVKVGQKQQKQKKSVRG